MEERLSGPFNPLESAGDEHTLRARFRTWQNNAAKGDERRFVERLALSGWTVEDALRSLRPVRLAEGAALPPWADTLQRMIRSIQSRRDATSAEKPAFLDAAKPEPFEELLVPFVRVAWEMLAEAEGERLSWLGERARRDLQRYCLKRLSRLSWQALELEYSAFRALDSDIARLFASRLRAHVGSESGRSVYLRFVENMFGGKYLEFLNEYSVLARLLAQAIDHWSAACGEFIRRYVQDREAIGEAILDGQAAGRIESLQLGLSDHHNGGRSVIIAELEGGRKVVYKPKPLQIPTAFLRLLNWLNERTDVPLDLKGMKLLDRGLYGWEEYIEHSPCKDHAEVQRYYYRAGAMLCLVYALDGTDFHGENIIACGEYPVLVDLETLLHPRLTTPFAEEKDGSAQMLAFDKVDRSVLSTLLLPIWKQLPNGGYALGGIFVHEDLGKVRARRLKEINSDGMSLKEQEIVVEPDHNAPVLNGRKVSIDAYLSDFVTGFQQMYETLLRHRDTLSDPAGPLAGFRGVPVRLVFRATSVYAKLLRQGLNPKFLRDGTDFALHFELLCRPALAHEERKRLWPIIRKEQQDMLRMDIPYFTMLTDRKEVEAGVGKWSEQLCETTCFERMMEKIRRLSAEDCRFQVSLIRGSMHARLAGVAHTAVKASFPDRKENPHRPPENIEVAAAGLDIAAEIAERLKAEMIEADDGTRTWIAPSLIHERYQYSPVGYDLYSGLSGIAMFFAALAKASGDPRYRQDALATLQMIRQDVRRHGQTVLNHMGIGGVGGFSSVIYAFAAVHRLIDAPDLLEDALEMVSLMTDGMIGQDRHFDVIQGSAGAIFALVALYDATRSEAVLHKASVCAGHLLRHRVEAANGLRVWKSGSFDRPLCGFSHGASGVAAALLRLYARTGDYALAAAAHEALAYERRLFRPDTDRWPDLRFAGEGREGLTDAWCHGAAGIGLARLEALRHVSPNEPDAEPYRAYRNELEKAVSIVRNAQWTGVTDAVCCGNMGRLEFLLAVSNQYSGSGDFPASADLPGVIRQHAEKMIVSYRKKGSFQFASHVQLEPPGFFQGLSGIGYQLLRILHPARLPSVLMFEI